MRLLTVALLLCTAFAGCLNPEGPIDRTPTDMESESMNSDGSWNLIFFGAGNDPFLGDVDAAVQVIAYDAPGCPNCKRYHETTYPSIKADYIEAGEIGYHFLQFRVGYPYDISGGVAEECAFREGGSEVYEDMLSRVFANRPTAGTSDRDGLSELLQAIAADYALDEAVLLACFDNDETLAEVEADIQAGRDSGAGSNPGFAVLGPDGFVEYVRGSQGPGEAIERALTAAA